MFTRKIKLTAEEKLFVINRVKSGETSREVARSVGVGESTVISWLKSEEKIKLAAEQERYVAEFCKMRPGYQRHSSPSNEMYVQVNSPASVASSSSPRVSMSASSSGTPPSSSLQEGAASSLFVSQEQQQILNSLAIGNLLSSAPEGQSDDIYKKLREQAVFLHSYYAGLYCFIVQHCGLPDDLKQEVSEIQDPIQELREMPDLNLFNYYPQQNGNGDDCDASQHHNGNGCHND